jgi:hypothetical protein
MSDKSSNRSSVKTAKRRSPPGLKHPIIVTQNEFNRRGNAVAEALAQFNLTAGNTVGGIFFDNDNKKITQVKEYCGNIVTVEVPESDCIENVKTIVNQLLKDNTTAFDFKSNEYFKLHSFTGSRHVFYDKISGVRKEHINVLKNWILDTGHLTTRVAFFDWDRTLTMCEGLIMPLTAHTHPNIADAYKMYKVIVAGTDEERENKIYEDMSIYLAGGNKRLKMLRKMFDMLHDRGIKIVILTNNGSCVNKKQEEYFYKLAKKFVGYDDIDFICSSETADPKKVGETGGNKGYALIRNPKYQAVCKGTLRSAGTTAGGHRRHKTRRHK